MLVDVSNQKKGMFKQLDIVYVLFPGIFVGNRHVSRGHRCPRLHQHWTQCGGRQQQPGGGAPAQHDLLCVGHLLQWGGAVRCTQRHQRYKTRVKLLIFLADTIVYPINVNLDILYFTIFFPLNLDILYFTIFFPLVLCRGDCIAEPSRDR